MTAIPLGAKPLPCTTKAGRDDYDTLIEGRGGNYGNRGDMRHVVARCLVRCNACPIKNGADGCWEANASENWVKRLKAGVEAVRPAAERPCEWCGTTMVLRAKQGQKRYCGPKCSQQALRARNAA